MQGCRPVGRVVRVTGAKGNAITHLDDMPALLVVGCLLTLCTHLHAAHLIAMKNSIDAVRNWQAAGILARNVGRRLPRCQKRSGSMQSASLMLGRKNALLPWGLRQVCVHADAAAFH